MLSKRKTQLNFRGDSTIHHTAKFSLIMKFTPIDVINDYPVCMYDCDQQKLVAIFKSKQVASKYVFDKPGYISSVTLRDKKKYKPISNRWLRTLTFRTATEEHRKLIPQGEYFFIADSLFNLEYTHSKIRNLEESREEELNREFEEQALALLENGYCQEEIADLLQVGRQKVQYVCGGKIKITKAISLLSIPEIEKLINILQNRINLILIKVPNDERSVATGAESE